MVGEHAEKPPRAYSTTPAGGQPQAWLGLLSTLKLFRFRKGGLLLKVDAIGNNSRAGGVLLVLVNVLPLFGFSLLIASRVFREKRRQGVATGSLEQKKLEKQLLVAMRWRKTTPHSPQIPSPLRPTSLPQQRSRAQP